LTDQPGTASQLDLSIVKDFLDGEQCREFINELRRSPASQAVTYGKGESAVDERVRRAKQISPSANTVGYVVGKLEEHRPRLEERFGIKLTGFEEPQFLCYRVGDFFVAHQDGNTGMVNLASDRTRRVSVTIFLNTQTYEQTPDTYAGGSLVFSDWRTGARQEISGEAGMLVGFRSEITHEVLPVTRGDRYAIVSWFRQ